MQNKTYETLVSGTETAVLVSFNPSGSRGEAAEQYAMEELSRLAETAGVEVADFVTQKRDTPDARTLIGKGKVEEVASALQFHKAGTVIFDQELSGAQVRNLERELDAKIIDRTQLILDIFAQRANTKEGKIQVELAQLSYLLPRLSGHGKNLSRLGGGIGTRGPGESQLEMDRRHIRDRISELKRQLQDVVRHRQMLRERRKKTGVFQAALVGYTNAGKTTLLNRLTKADAYEQNQLFATLDPLSRALKLESGKEAVLTDTVGFIQNLPHDLVAAFRATLEEVCEADLIVHVVDVSSDMHTLQMDVVDQVLSELGAQNKERLLVYNKIDLCTEEQKQQLLAEGTGILKISANDEGDLLRLKEAIDAKLGGASKLFYVPAEKGEIISLLFRIGTVLEQDLDEAVMRLSVHIQDPVYDKYAYMLSGYEHRPTKLPDGS